MADPTKYTPSYDFSDYQAQAPSTPLPGAQVDIQFQEIKVAVDSTVNAIKDVRRSDGKLKNQSVGPDQLSPALNIGFTNEGTWTEGASYSSGDGVFHEQIMYSARMQNTATALNRPDLSPSTWNFLFSVADFIIPDNSIGDEKLMDGAIGLRDGDKGDVIVSGAGTVWSLARQFNTVALGLADTAMTYAAGVGQVTPGQHVKFGQWHYEVADSAASDHHVTTAGGVKLYVIEAVLQPEMFGQIGVNAAGDTAAWVALVAAAEARTRAHVVARGEYLVDASDIAFAPMDYLNVDARGAIFRQQSNFSKTVQATDLNEFHWEGGTFYGRGGAAGEFNGGSSSLNGVAAICVTRGEVVHIHGVTLIGHAGGHIQSFDALVNDIHDNTIIGIGSAYISAGNNGSDIGIMLYAGQSPGGLATIYDDWKRIDKVYRNRIYDTAFGVQSVKPLAMHLNNNDIGPIQGQHGFYGIEVDVLNASGNFFHDTAQQGIKVQLENYAGRFNGTAWVTATGYVVGNEVRESTNLYICVSSHTSGTFATDLAASRWAISQKSFRNGGVISGNTSLRCGALIAMTSSSQSDGKETYIRGLSITGNTALDSLQDGFSLDRCVDVDCRDNVILGAGRYGILARNSSGNFNDNTMKRTVASAIFAFLSFDSAVNDNLIVDCGLTGTGTDAKYPVNFQPTGVDALPSQKVNPDVSFDRNTIRFSTGDAASSQLTYFDARYNMGVERLITNSALTIRVNGTLRYQFRNDVGFNNIAQNPPTYTASGTSTSRALATAMTLPQLVNVVATIVDDLEAAKLLKP